MRDVRHARRNRAEYFQIVIVATALAALAGSPAAAQLSADSDEPLDITSDRLETENNIATWIGEVRVVQGESILTSERLIITQTDDGGIEEIRAVGDVRYSNGKEAIRGDVAIYTETSRTIRMRGDVVITQGEQVLTGDDLTYWIDTGKTHFAARDGQRVRGVFKTQSLDNQS
ncbi:MAG: hypothetical protein GC152_10905 [Alphaproteobacteria bacterium]|nr:hypothetical protein [Alphaproteobacteria bacterium]